MADLIACLACGERWYSRCAYHPELELGTIGWPGSPGGLCMGAGCGGIVGADWRCRRCGANHRDPYPPPYKEWKEPLPHG